MKKVYVGMVAEFLHVGHINIIINAQKYGEVIIGLLTDDAICEYKRCPITNYDQRKMVIENVKGVSRVVPQCTHDYTDNLLELKPDFVVHGDDWRVGIQKKTRDKIIDTLKMWDGKLIEVPYTDGISSSIIFNLIKQNNCRKER